MAADYLKQRYFRRFGIHVIVPDEDEQAVVDRIIFHELVRRVLTPESKTAYLGIVDRLRGRGAQGIILGCTEIFLLISQVDRPDFQMFDTTALHVRSAVDLAFF